VIPSLHVVTDDRVISRSDFLRVAGLVLEAGGPDLALHLRGPRSSGRRLHSLARALRPLALESDSVLLVNDRIDVALTVELSGVHLGQRSLPPQTARSLLGPRKLLGLSVHGPEEAESDEGNAVDFYLVGTIYSSASHPGAGGSGVGRIRQIRERTRIPLFAIGGVTPDRVGEVVEAGASGAAVLGGIWDAEDLQGAVRGYLKELGRGKGRSRGGTG